MKKILIVLILISLLSSCSKIQTEDQIKNNQKTSYKWIETCWINSCNLKIFLEEEYKKWKLNLPNLDKYRERFKTLLDIYKNKDELIASSDFQKFASDINKDFFWCEWDIYKCSWTNPYWYNETNYLFYIFIPNMVVDEYIIKRWLKEADAETVIQAIKRKDFVSYEEKEVKIELYKKQLKDLIKTMDLSKIDKNRLWKDLNYFNEIIMHPVTWIHDNIIKEIYSIKIDWEEWDQIDRIVSITLNEFYDLMNKLWISKEKIISNIRQTYWFKSNDINEDLIKRLGIKIKLMNKTYNLDWKIPSDRYFRNDELYVFTKENRDLFIQNLSEWEIDNFNKDSLYIRHFILLLFNLGREQDLYFLTDRLKKENFEEKFILTNVFKYSKYIDFKNNFIQ